MIATAADQEKQSGETKKTFRLFLRALSTEDNLPRRKLVFRMPADLAWRGRRATMIGTEA